MIPLILCLKQTHDARLVAAAVAICVLGVYATYAISAHARRSRGRARSLWGGVTLACTGCTAWATHFVLLLAFRPGVPSGFEPVLTLVSLLVALVVIGAGVVISAYSRKLSQRFVGGMVMGGGVAALHYLGQAAYRVEGVISWDTRLVVGSILVSIVVAGGSSVASGMRARWVRRAGPPLLLLAIYLLHFSGMAAARIYYDPTRALPRDVIAPSLLAPLVAGVAVLAMAMAVVGLRFDLAAKKRQRFTRERLRELASVALEGLIVCDGETVMTVNESLERLCGLGEADLKGKTLGLLVQGPVLAEMAEDEEYDAELLGSSVPVPVRVLRRTVSAGARPQTVVAVRDQRERLRAEAEREALMEDLRRSLALAEAANTAKSEFLANMSHEIRTPLNGVLGMTQALAMGPLDSVQRERVELIAQSGQTLMSLLNDVLDLAKIEAGRLDLHPVDFDLEPEVRATCAVFADLAERKGLSLQVDFATEAGGVWRGDAARLRQILSNLLANAVKFTPAGHVRVQLRPGDDGGILLAVSDTGIGIAADQLPRLFSKFHQVDGAHTRRFGGTGLGLAICRELVELMRGVITVESAEGAGAIFTVRLPLSRSCAATAEAAAAVHTLPLSASTGPAASRTTIAPARGLASAETLEGLRVLAAEDNVANQKVLCALLQAFDVTPTVVETGVLAVQAWGQGGFDLILMDVQMPEMDGVTATRRIRALEAQAGLAPIPIVGLTANVMAHQVESYLKAGMDDIIAKPIEIGRLVQTLQAVSAHPSGEGQPNEQAA